MFKQSRGSLLNNSPVSRRLFLKLGVCAAAATLMPAAALARTNEGERNISLYNTHTGESLRTTYWVNGRYLPESLDQINFLLRDHRTDEVAVIDSDEIDLLNRLNASLQSNRVIEIISGYRSPATNSRLAANSSGVAKRSLHMKGMAIDLRIPGHDLRDVHRAAMALKAGGVGYYPRSGFVHTDVGRVRYWQQG